MKTDLNKPLYIDNMMCIDPQICYSPSTISIIITAYNEQKLIKYAIQSILQQTYVNIEIIFVDDASTDNTIDIFLQTCKQYGFNNYTLICMKQNSGPFITKNIGLHYATGDYITFHDADDWAHPQRLEEQIKVLENSNAVASISKLVRIKPTGELFSKHIYPLDRIAMVSLMIKRSVVDELGYFYTDLLGADSEYVERIKLYYGENKFIKVPKVLTFAAHRPNSRTTSIETGTPEFGSNPLREQHWNELSKRLKRMTNAERAYYVPFDIMTYKGLLKVIKK